MFSHISSQIFSQAPFKVLQLSVGSLLGQVMLDVLAARRSTITLIGMNSVAEAPANFSCDRIYLTPQTADHEAYMQCFKKVLAEERPDLILPGRDEDVCFLACFREQNPQWQQAIPCGSAALAQKIRDKYECFLWAEQRDLPFAHSLLYTAEKPTELPPFIQTTGFPILAKPRQGFGSKGIFFLQSVAEIESLAASLKDAPGDLLLQEYLGDPGFLTPYFRDYAQAMPLFFQIPETQQFSAQGLITPQGKIGPVFCAQSTLVMGRTERFCPYTSAALEQLFMDYARALRNDGWRGVVNLQAKPHARTGQWKAFELNLRMSGGTACRLDLGFDEMRHLIQAFYPQVNFPEIPHTAMDLVFPSFKNQSLKHAWVTQLASQKVFTP